MTHLVERLEAFEDRLGLRLQGLLALRYDVWTTWQAHGEVISKELPYLRLTGEVVATKKTELGKTRERRAIQYFEKLSIGFRATVD